MPFPPWNFPQTLAPLLVGYRYCPIPALHWWVFIWGELVRWLWGLCWGWLWAETLDFGCACSGVCGTHTSTQHNRYTVTHQRCGVWCGESAITCSPQLIPTKKWPHDIDSRCHSSSCLATRTHPTAPLSPQTQTQGEKNRARFDVGDKHE